jgi:enterochelin esterase-like enzyme
MNWHKKFVDKKLKFFGLTPYQGMWWAFIKGVIFTGLLFLFFDHYKINNDNKVKFEIDYSDKFQENGFDGRVLLMISNNKYSEPRFQINDNHNTQMIFGVDINSWNSSEKIIIDSEAFSYPIESINNIKEGEYYVQALLHKYETFNLSTGYTVQLPMDQGEGQKWNISPKNLYSTPKKVKINKSGTINITLENEIPPIEPAKDTEYIKHIKIKSEMLSKFWGRDMYLQANVLVPHGFDKKSKTRYPLMIFHGHFPYTFGGFRTTQPTAPKEDTIYNSRFGITGYKYIQQKEAYDLYHNWISNDFPRFITIEIQHQNPYYDDSYAVNSANLGPYGDAITYELIPHIEQLFNGVGEGWGRFLYGGSTGGWESLAVQVFYPNEYNGCFAACPDPIDFRAYTVINLYEDDNAYYHEGSNRKTLRAGMRDGKGIIKNHLIQINQRESALGSKGRSGDQWDIWQAVYSPTGKDGYPKPIWDRKTGKIDKEVAEYWKENYDLSYIMKRDWDKIGKDLEGKIHIYCGDMDNYYLNNAVVLTEEFLESTTNPYYNGEVDYGNMAEHCWNGDQKNPNQISRLRYNTMYIPKIRDRLKKTAPKNNNLKNWGI